MSRRGVRIATLAVLLPSVGVLSVGALSACASPTPLTGVTVDARQTRFDGPLRQVQLSVSNTSDHPITVIRAELDSTRFASPVAFDRPQRIPAGSARDLPVRLPEAVCDGGDPIDLVHLTVEGTGGSPATATVAIADTAVLDAITTSECFIAAVAAIAVIEPPSQAPWMPATHAPVTLEFTVRPTGSAGSLTIHDVGATTLFAHVDGGGARIIATPVDLAVDATADPALITVLLEPSRCDPHAIAEDKKGTILPFSIELDGQRMTVPIAVGDEVRASLYDYVSAWCATGP